MSSPSFHRGPRQQAASARPGRPPAGQPAMRIAVIGSGISGLSAALRLTPAHAVTVFESQPRLGGHAHSVEVNLDGHSAQVDTGFLVYNHRTYPRLVALFDELEVPTAASDMSFSVSVGPCHDFEWCGLQSEGGFRAAGQRAATEFLANAGRHRPLQPAGQRAGDTSRAR